VSFCILKDFLWKSTSSENEPQGSKRTRKGYGFKARKKALRGKPHEHCKHEIRLKESKNDERQEGSQTLQVFLTDKALSIHLQFFES
jgi:hypothetical protein